MAAVLAGAGTARGDLVAVVTGPPGTLGLAADGGSWSLALDAPGVAGVVAGVEAALRPRWVLWSAATAVTLVRSGVRVALAWDIEAVHRLLFGGLAADPARVWAVLAGLDPDGVPASGPQDLFAASDPGGGGDPGDPVRPDGHLRPEWAAREWRVGGPHPAGWAALALRVAALQAGRLTALGGRAEATARSESTAALLCAEMTVDGLPLDRAVAEDIVAGFIGARPTDGAGAAAHRARRDAAVLAHAGPGVTADLRSTVAVRDLLGRLGVDVPDTRAWRLRTVADRHPIVPALLAWRKAERLATTYGYAWLDHAVDPDGRLRGVWATTDGAAGRMTASAGLHNLPADLRPAVVADPGQVFVRADLGQIEPRVLATVSGDASLAAASLVDDLYAPVAAQLGVDRATAKVAVLGAMYGQTTGHGAQALRRLDAAYPVAMAFLARAARDAEAGRDLRTWGGRLVRTGGAVAGEGRGAAAARGRYGRNALIQGAAAELFKTWAVALRARLGAHGGRIVLCLHDELLVQVPEGSAGEVAALLASCLTEAVAHWAPATAVRFVAEVSVARRWSEAKERPPS